MRESSSTSATRTIEATSNPIVTTTKRFSLSPATTKAKPYEASLTITTNEAPTSLFASTTSKGSTSTSAPISDSSLTMPGASKLNLISTSTEVSLWLLQPLLLASLHQLAQWRLVDQHRIAQSPTWLIIFDSWNRHILQVCLGFCNCCKCNHMQGICSCVNLCLTPACDASRSILNPF